MSILPYRELNCSKSLDEIASLDYSVPLDCYGLYVLVSRFAGQSCHSSPTCRKTCLCMDRIHLSLQETMTLKPVNEVDAQFKFMLFLCQVSLDNGLVVSNFILVCFISSLFSNSLAIWRNLMAPFSVLQSLVPVSLLMFIQCF